MLYRIKSRLSEGGKNLAAILARVAGVLDQEDRYQAVLDIYLHIGAVSSPVTKGAVVLQGCAVPEPATNGPPKAIPIAVLAQ
jgi:hypothetical protein